MVIAIIIVLIATILGIKHIYDPSFDNIMIDGEPTTIMWYNDYDWSGNIVRKYIILWH